MKSPCPEDECQGHIVTTNGSSAGCQLSIHGKSDRLGNNIKHEEARKNWNVVLSFYARKQCRRVSSVIRVNNTLGYIQTARYDILRGKSHHPSIISFTPERQIHIPISMSLFFRVDRVVSRTTHDLHPNPLLLVCAPDAHLGTIRF